MFNTVYFNQYTVIGDRARSWWHGWFFAHVSRTGGRRTLVSLAGVVELTKGGYTDPAIITGKTQTIPT